MTATFAQTINLRPYQVKQRMDIHAAFITHDRVMAEGATGTGKCLGKGTPVLMHDGRIKPVEDVLKGDLLMGPDSNPRRVLSTCTGTEMLYRVTPTKGEPYIVNESHILSLKVNGGFRHVAHNGIRYNPGDIANVSVLSFLSAKKHFKHCAKTWRTGVVFSPHKTIHPMPPYILGVWLGDGDSCSPGITTGDPEVLEAVQEYASSIGHSVRRHKGRGCEMLDITTGQRTGRGECKNGMLIALRRLGVLNNKHIPFQIKTGSRRDRLDVLAGLLDSDGHMTCGGFDFISKSQRLADDLCFVARSLGFAAYIKSCVKCCQTGAYGVYYRVSISGDCGLIPCKIARKKASARRQKKNILVSSIKVEPIGVGCYFGFEIDGPDRLFLLGDFTVTHNTTLFSALCQDFVAMGKRVLVIVNRERLVRQAAARIHQQTGIEVDIEMAGEHASPFAMVVVASVPTLMRLNRLTSWADDNFGLLICDEAHHSGADGWLRVIRWFHWGSASLAEDWVQPKEYTPHCKVLGVTATPDDDWGDLFQHAIQPYTLIQAVEDGWLVPLTAKSMPLKIDLKGLRPGRTVNGSDLRPDQIEARLIPVIEALADQVKELAGDRKTIIFWPSVKCARLGDEAMSRRGLNSFFVSGECIDLHEKTAAFVASGKGTVLNNAILYCEGADFPDIDCVVPARATKQRGFFRQMIGRGTRVLPGIVDGIDTPEERRAAIAASAKPDLLILDPLWITDKIDLCDAYDVFASGPEVKEKMKAAGELTPENAKESERDFLKALEKEAKKHARKAARTINPLAFAVSLGESSIADYKPETSAEAGPLTAIQIEYLKAAEFNYSVLTCAGQADKIIKRLETRKQLGLASPKMLQLLLRLGLPEEQAALMKKGQAGAIIGAKTAAWRR